MNDLTIQPSLLLFLLLLYLLIIVFFSVLQKLGRKKKEEGKKDKRKKKSEKKERRRWKKRKKDKRKKIWKRIPERRGFFIAKKRERGWQRGRVQPTSSRHNVCLNRKKKKKKKKKEKKNKKRKKKKKKKKRAGDAMQDTSRKSPGLTKSSSSALTFLYVPSHLYKKVRPSVRPYGKPWWTTK